MKLDADEEKRKNLRSSPTPPTPLLPTRLHALYRAGEARAGHMAPAGHSDAAVMGVTFAAPPRLIPPRCLPTHHASSHPLQHLTPLLTLLSLLMLVLQQHHQHDRLNCRPEREKETLIGESWIFDTRVGFRLSGLWRSRNSKKT